MNDWKKEVAEDARRLVMRIGTTQYGHARALICIHSKHEVELHARLTIHAMQVGFMPPPDCNALSTLRLH